MLWGKKSITNIKLGCVFETKLQGVSSEHTKQIYKTLTDNEGVIDSSYRTKNRYEKSVQQFQGKTTKT